MSVLFEGEGNNNGKKKLKLGQVLETILKVLENTMAGQAKMSEETTRILSMMVGVMVKQQESKAR